MSTEPKYPVVPTVTDDPKSFDAIIEGLRECGYTERNIQDVRMGFRLGTEHVILAMLALLDKAKE